MENELATWDALPRAPGEDAGVEIAATFTFARLAMSRTVVPVSPRSPNRSSAASRMRARVRSGESGRSVSRTEKGRLRGQAASKMKEESQCRRMVPEFLDRGNDNFATRGGP